MNVESLISGGSPTAKFPEIGTSVRGKITACEENQQTDYDTGKPIVYEDSGKPAMQLVFTLQTDQRDPAIENDDGERRIFARGQMRSAIKEAVRESGQKTGTVVGGTLAVRYEEDKPITLPSGKKVTQKIYRVKYEPPVAGGTAVEDW